ncbi:peptidase C1B, bleomycin hydrolase [Exidia glandulosa HHB12029]|uniref:Cysteine proteinase 1, mitochondrial n=1 Tax=Exidia glandulosa HHB12029 TaxID=1314781 RepID=A0A165KFZ0_EXIGL|nr:peptidase C1B, bleomycin hydrolase [Exidia glandulosa HHB12029]
MGASASTARPEAEESVRDEKREIIESFGSMSLAGPARPLSTAGTVTARNLARWEDAAQSLPTTALARTIFAHSDLKSTVAQRQAQVADSFVFNTSVHFPTGPRTNQKSSGRCWLFATTNVLRYEVMQRLKLDDFQLSQSYLFIWDKLEKANYYLEQSIEHADKPIDDRLVEHLARGPLSDGGQWDMACNLLEKYGVVPQAVYPESFSSSASGTLNQLLTTEVREHALKLRKLHKKLAASSLSAEEKTSSLRATKEELMASVWTTITSALGVPPQPDDKFTWEYYDKHGKYGKFEGTPKDFLAAFTSKPTESFSLIHDPRNTYGKLYTVAELGNIWGMRDVLYVNTEIDRLKAAVVTAIKAGVPVFFGCDVGKCSDRITGIMDPALHDLKATPCAYAVFQSAFPLSLGLTKAERLQTGESAMTHAMVISAVHLDASGKPVRYRVENSWGTDVGDKGWFVMTDKWFEEFVYQVVIPNRLAPKDLLDIFNSKKKVVLPAWDPMGALA